MIPVRTWLLRLAMRCVPVPEEELDVKVTEYARGLADLPPGAFTPASLELISRDTNLIPPYAALRTALEAWWDANKPPAVGTASKLSLGTLAAVQAWTNAPFEEREARLAVARRYQPKAFEHLLQTHDGARSIARKFGWLSAPDLGAKAAAELPT